jgi:formamidopyrimidine-DNA glycosylase
MPELPEVEYVARQLRVELVGRDLLKTSVYCPRSIGHMDAAAFAEALSGRHIVGIDRRGKYLLVRLDHDTVLVVHRGMSGNLLLADSPEDVERVSYVCAAFGLDDGRFLLYSDPRKFGRLMLLPEAELSTWLERLGPEPLDEHFTPDALASRLAGTRRPMKAVLLDQGTVAGLGNIYADEALFEARIHPLRIAGGLSRDEILALHAAIQSVLQTGIEHGGTTFGRHRDLYDQVGRNLPHVMVYRRTSQPCLRCGSAISRIIVAGRGTHFCPQCQGSA